MEICAETHRAFVHAVGNYHLAKAWTDNLFEHAKAVVLRENERGKPWADVAAWASRSTRRTRPTYIRHSSAIDRDIAADMANTILFNLITEGRA